MGFYKPLGDTNPFTPDDGVLWENWVLADMYGPKVEEGSAEREERENSE